MKKTILALLCLLIIFTLCSCNDKTDKDITEPESTNQVVNPMTETDEKGIEENIGVKIKIPSSFKDCSYHLINYGNQDTIGQAGFEYKEVYYTFRVMKSTNNDDISGMYFNWTEDSDCEINGIKGEIHIFNSKEENAASLLLFDSENGVMYTLSTSDKVTADEILKCAEMILK